MKTIIGIFDDPQAARRALEALRDGPLPLEDVSIVSRATESGAAVTNDDDVSAAEGAAVGAVWGGLVGLAALLIPGVGPFVAGGALFAALTGALTGAVVGGVAAALIDFGGISEEEARGYEAQVHAGKTLIAVKARDEDTAEARRILNSFGAESVRDDQALEVGAPQGRVHVAMYDESGNRVHENLDADPRIAGTRIDDTRHPSGLPADTDYGRGIDDTAPPRTNDPYATREIPAKGQRTADQTWTSGEVVGEGQGQGPRKDTGTYDADQWVGEGQGEPGDDSAKRRQ
jgi:uncharacterized membrane protein